MSDRIVSVKWASKIGFVLAAGGSAIGLGAIWKFPYVAGTNGEARFFSCLFYLRSYWDTPSIRGIYIRTEEPF
ncbi:hypothetical protein QKW52_02245 [Bacillus sonorensis]|nr:hypothetical protein [Bacillus sonorensis]